MKSLELFTSVDEAVRRQFNEDRHIALRGLFDSIQAQQILDDIKGRFPRFRTRSNREKVAAVNGLPTIHGETAFDDLVEKVNATTQKLGHALLAGQGSKIHSEIIEMEPDCEGAVHTDSNRIGPITAVTNLEGLSGLRITGIGEYTLETGDVAIIQGQAVSHQGLSYPAIPRVGLIVTTLNLRQP